jgi:hypothetical protein
MESIPLFTGFIINVLCDLAVHGTCTLCVCTILPYSTNLREATLPAALQSAGIKFAFRIQLLRFKVPSF